MFRKYKHLFLIGLLFFIPVSISANTVPIYLGLSLGTAKVNASSLGPQITVDDATPPSVAAYHVNNNHQSVTEYGVFGGWQLTPWRNLNRLKLQLGLGVYRTQEISTTGYGDINSYNNFNFSYRMSSLRAMLESRFLYQINSYFQPQLYLGLGYGQLSTTHFSAQPDDVGTAELPIYNNYQTNNLVSSVGLGVLSMLNTHWGLSLNYQINHLGTAALGASATTLQQSILKTAQITQNSANLNISYLF